MSRLKKVFDMKPTTGAALLLIALWFFFQVHSDSPPPVLDQLLVGVFGAWFTNEAIDKRKELRSEQSIKKDDKS